MRPLHKGTFSTIFLSDLNFIPRKILYIPVVEIFTFVERGQKLTFFKNLNI